MLRKNEIEYNKSYNKIFSSQEPQSNNIINKQKSHSVGKLSIELSNSFKNSRKDSLILKNRKSAFSINQNNITNFENDIPIIFTPKNSEVGLIKSDARLAANFSIAAAAELYDFKKESN